jgi:hypothetical protein
VGVHVDRDKIVDVHVVIILAIFALVMNAHDSF